MKANTRYSANLTSIIANIDDQLATLQQARALLAEDGKVSVNPKTRTEAKTKKKKHKVTPEGRKRIVEAVKRRWAKQKRA